MAYQPYQQGPNRYAPSYYHHQNYPGMHTPSAYYGHQAAMVYDPQAGQAQPALDTSPTHSFPGAGMPSSAMTSPTYLGSQYPPTYQAYQPYYPTPGAGTTVTGPHSNAHAHHAGPRQLPPGQPALGAAAQGSEMQPSPSQSATPTARSSPSLGQAEAASENGSHYSPYTSVSRSCSWHMCALAYTDSCQSRCRCQPYQPYSSFNFYSPSTSSPVPAPASLQGLPQQQYAMGTSYPTPNQPGVQYETFGTAPSAHPQPLGANQRQAPNVHGPAVYSSYMLPWRPPPVPGYGYGQVNVSMMSCSDVLIGLS